MATTVPLSFDIWARDHASGTFTKVGGSVDTLSNKMRRFGGSMSSLGSRLTTGVTLPVVALGVASVKMAADFDQTMRQIAVATGAPTKALESLALEMGAKTVFSAGDAADAMLELAKNGITPATIQAGALKNALTLAAAGGVDLKTAATAMSNSLNAFGLSGKQSAEVANALAGAANASSASIDSLTEGLQQVSAVAADSGLSIQETTAALAAFANAGIKGSDAGTSLKTFLARLVPTTEAAQKGFNYLHLGFTKANGDFKSLAQISEVLQKKFGNMSQAERAVAFNTLFGSDARRAATVLMNEGAEGIRKYIKAASDQNSAQRMANASMQGMSGALERAKGSLQTAAIIIGQRLAPIVEQVAGKIEEWANAFSSLSPKTQAIIIGVAALAAAAGPLLLIVGGLVTAIAAIASPIGLGVAAFVALSAAIAAAYTSSSTFRKQVNEALTQVQATIQSFVAAATAFWDRFGSTIMRVARVYFGGAFRIISGVLKEIQGVLDVFTGILTGDWSLAWKGVKEIASGALRALTGIFQVVFAGFIAIVKAKGGQVVAWFQSLPGKVMNALGGLTKAMEYIGVQIMAGLIRGLASMLDDLRAIASTIGNTIKDVVRFGLAITSPSKVMHDIGVNAMQGLIDGLTSKIQTLKQTMQSVTDMVSGLFGNPLGGENVNTVADIFRQQRSETGDATRLRNDIKKLLHKGLDMRFITDMISTGNLTALHALAEAPASQVRRFERGERRLERVERRSSGMLNQGTRDRVADLKEQRREYERMLDRLEKAVKKGIDGAHIVIDGHGNAHLKIRTGGV